MTVSNYYVFFLKKKSYSLIYCIPTGVFSPSSSPSTLPPKSLSSRVTTLLFPSEKDWPSRDSNQMKHVKL